MVQKINFVGKCSRIRVSDEFLVGLCVVLKVTSVNQVCDFSPAIFNFLCSTTEKTDV
jgi:hypothetical protein